MIWVVIAIVVVGFFIVGAVNRNTRTNALIAVQQAQQTEDERQQKIDDEIKKEELAHLAVINSPEYKKQMAVSLDYFEFLKDTLLYKTTLTQKQIDFLNPPKEYRTHWDIKTGVFLGYFKHTTLKDELEIKKALKLEIKQARSSIQQCQKEWDDKLKNNYSGYYPEEVGIMKKKYDLDEPFMPDGLTDYINTNNESSWSLYEDSLHKLSDLENTFNELKG
jgi:uncharacterized membrane-anchored protein YhcB (DUF1043 family)